MSRERQTGGGSLCRKNQEKTERCGTTVGPATLLVPIKGSSLSFA
jgi:hypothetical protein